jgi:hypothetical protein
MIFGREVAVNDFRASLDKPTRSRHVSEELQLVEKAEMEPMRSVLALVVTLMSTTCFAASLPIAGDYGSEAGCASTPPFTVDSGSDLLRLTSTAMNGLEWACSFDRVTKRNNRYSVAASCSADGATKPVRVTIVEHPDGTLTYKARNGRFTLHRCKP